MIDVIIPVLDEEDCLKRHEEYYKTLGARARIIFVDGGSTDRTVETAGRHGEVVQSAKGRGIQKNRGFEASQAEYLLFLHADTMINPSILDSVQGVLHRGVSGGCFTIAINDGAFVFRIFECMLNWRARHAKVIDGDLGQFVRRDVFVKIGGYDAVPIMEDILFSYRLKRSGSVVVLPDIITSSSRKWRRHGFWTVFFQYCRAYIRLWLR